MPAYIAAGLLCLLVAALFIGCHYADPHRAKADRRARR